MISQHPSPNVKTFCKFEPQIWLEIITSRDAKSACFKGSRTSCREIVLGIFWPNFGWKRSHHVMDASCRTRALRCRPCVAKPKLQRLCASTSSSRGASWLAATAITNVSVNKARSSSGINSGKCPAAKMAYPRRMTTLETVSAKLTPNFAFCCEPFSPLQPSKTPETPNLSKICPSDCFGGFQSGGLKFGKICQNLKNGNFRTKFDKSFQIQSP